MIRGRAPEANRGRDPHRGPGDLDPPGAWRFAPFAPPPRSRSNGRSEASNPPRSWRTTSVV